MAPGPTAANVEAFVLDNRARMRFLHSLHGRAELLRAAVLTRQPQHPVALPSFFTQSSLCLPASLASAPLLQSIALSLPFSLPLMLSRHLCNYDAVLPGPPRLSWSSICSPTRKQIR